MLRSIVRMYLLSHLFYYNIFLSLFYFITGGTNNGTVISAESEFGMPSSITTQFCLISFILMPLEKAWNHLPPASKINSKLD